MVPDESRLGVFVSPLLLSLKWLDHGFGGKHATEWPPEVLATATKQVHGARVLRASREGDCGEGDALITTAPGLFVGVRTADCVPVLLADARQRKVAAVHAGWRGTAARIVEHTVAAMGSRPRDLFAACGPSIGACCYEVGPEVATVFGQEGRVHLDLVAENLRQLAGLGVPGPQIESLPVPCTRCGADHFHSFRRDGDAAGRMVSAIAVR